MIEYKNEHVIVEKYENKVAKVILNNPPVNVVSTMMSEELHDVVNKLAVDEDIRCIVLCSFSQKHFCVGSDVKQFPYVWDDPIGKKMLEENTVFNAFEYLPQPTIAAIEGVACGGGLELASTCSIRLIGESTRMALPEINLGVHPGSGGCFRVSKIIGPTKTTELALLGEFIDAQECYRIGLANAVYPDGTVVEEAMKWAAKIAAKPWQSARAVKSSVREMWMKTSEECFWENLHTAGAMFLTNDCHEGVQAFLEKRAPNFE